MLPSFASRLVLKVAAVLGGIMALTSAGLIAVSTDFADSLGRKAADRGADALREQSYQALQRVTTEQARLYGAELRRTRTLSQLLATRAEGLLASGNDTASPEDRPDLRPAADQPIRRLAHAADQIRAGQYGAHVPANRKDELGQTGTAFNEMSDRLAGLVEDLEDRVSERTAEAEEARRHIQSILENSPVSITFLDSERRIQRVNSAFLDLFPMGNRRSLATPPNSCMATRPSTSGSGGRPIQSFGKGAPT